MKKATFIVPPELLWPHGPNSEFIGPSAVALGGGRILLVVAPGRPPLALDEQRKATSQLMRYLSEDEGRTWRLLGPSPLAQIDGQPIGTSTILPFGGDRLAFLNCQALPNHHGGGLYTFSISDDLGATFTSTVEIAGREEILYSMPERLIRLRSGRLLFPSAVMPPEGKYEGDVNVGVAFFSDDEGRTWQRSSGQTAMPGGGNSRGMAEPVAVELRDGRLLMLARTGVGCHCASWSLDGGDTWSAPERTQLTAACSPLSLKRLPDAPSAGSGQGRLFVVYNHTEPISPGAFFPRTPLVYAVSSDEGQSWSDPVVIDDEGAVERNRQLIYPSITFCTDGVLIIYSVHAADPDGSFNNGGPDGWQIGGGKRCVVDGTGDDIRAYVKRMMATIGNHNGGLCSMAYSQPEAVGHTPEKTAAMCAAFRDLGGCQ